jgi:hypothetical protein
METIRVKICEMAKVISMEVSQEDSVQQTIDRLMLQIEANMQVRYGLYNPKFGLWLSTEKTILTYDFNSQVG